MKDKKRPRCLWDTVSGSLIVILFPSSPCRHVYIKIKLDCPDTSMLWPQNLKSFYSPFFTWVFTGDPISTKWSYKAPTCFGAVYFSYWNGLYHWFVKIMLLVCGSIGSNHNWNLIQAPIIYHCFYPSMVVSDFCNNFSAYSKLIYVSERFSCN